MDRISKLCLEGNTERSESNPGRSLGTTDKRRAAVWKTVPANELTQLLPFELFSKKFCLNISELGLEIV